MIDVPDFDAVYRKDPDPWRVRSSFYEVRKLALLLACLGRESYARAWDPACGVGELAARLSERSAAVLASDGSTEAVALTAERCADRPQVQVQHRPLPTAPDPVWVCDLVVLSEFVYYLDPADRVASLDLVDARTTPDAEVVALHWRHKPHDGWLSGLDVQAEITAGLQDRGWRTVVRHDDRDFTLASFERVGR